MPYATETDLLDRMGEHEMRQVADHTRSGTADTEVVAAALADADNLIDGYVGARYATPLPSIPPLVRTWAVSIARYVLHRNGAPDHVEQDYKDAMAALKDVSRGLIALPVMPGEAAPTATGGTVMAEHPAPVFTRRKLRGF